MSLQTNRISDLDNKGADLEATDLFYISVPDISSPTGYVTKALTGQQIFNAVSGGAGGGKNFGQTQWGTSLPAPITIPNGSTYNVFDAFDNVADKNANGTTPYDEYNFQEGLDYIQLEWSGSGGSGDVIVNGTNYSTSFDTDINNTAFLWSKTYNITPQPDTNAVYIGNNIVYLFFTGAVPTVTYTQNTANLNVSISGVQTLPTTLQIPYVATAYEGLRLAHTIRVSLNIDTATIQTLTISFRRSADDTIIGGVKRIQRNPDVAGDQFVFETYTKDEFDPFVTAGFYLRIDNNSGVSIDLIDKIDFLIITHYQENVIFP